MSEDRKANAEKEAALAHKTNMALVSIGIFIPKYIKALEKSVTTYKNNKMQKKIEKLGSKVTSKQSFFEMYQEKRIGGTFKDIHGALFQRSMRISMLYENLASQLNKYQALVAKKNPDTATLAGKKKKIKCALEEIKISEKKFSIFMQLGEKALENQTNPMLKELRTQFKNMQEQSKTMLKILENIKYDSIVSKTNFEHSEKLINNNIDLAKASAKNIDSAVILDQIKRKIPHKKIFWDCKKECNVIKTRIIVDKLLKSKKPQRMENAQKYFRNEITLKQLKQLEQLKWTKLESKISNKEILSKLKTYLTDASAKRTENIANIQEKNLKSITLMPSKKTLPATPTKVTTASLPPLMLGVAGQQSQLKSIKVKLEKMQKTLAKYISPEELASFNKNIPALQQALAGNNFTQKIFNNANILLQKHNDLMQCVVLKEKLSKPLAINTASDAVAAMHLSKLGARMKIISRKLEDIMKSKELNSNPKLISQAKALNKKHEALAQHIATSNKLYDDKNEIQANKIPAWKFWKFRAKKQRTTDLQTIQDKITATNTTIAELCNKTSALSWSLQETQRNHASNQVNGNSNKTAKKPIVTQKINAAQPEKPPFLSETMKKHQEINKKFAPNSRPNSGQQ